MSHTNTLQGLATEQTHFVAAIQHGGMPQLEHYMERLLLSDPNPTPGVNNHSTDRKGGEETDAPLHPSTAALAGWEHPLWASSHSVLERKEAFPHGTGETKLFKHLS